MEHWSHDGIGGSPRARRLVAQQRIGLIALGVCLPCAGCDRSPQSDPALSSSALVPPPPILDATAGALALEPSARALNFAPSPAPDYAGPLAQRCFAGYAPLGDAARDVMQVGLLCGPAAGLKAQPVVSQTGPGVFEQRWELGAGACVRAVVAAERREPNALKVQLRAASAALGQGPATYLRGDSGALVVAPGRSELCLSAPGQVTLVVESELPGRVVYQAWRR